MIFQICYKASGYIQHANRLSYAEACAYAERLHGCGMASRIQLRIVHEDDSFEVARDWRYYGGANGRICEDAWSHQLLRRRRRQE